MSIKTASITSIMNLTNNDAKGSDLKNKDLQIECIIRGMGFEDVLKRSFFGLSNWLVEHCMLPINLDLLEQYDNWLEEQLHKRGADELIHNSLRLGYVKRDDADETEVRVKKEKVVKEKKAPRKKDARGLYEGTKKSYTYECQARGKTLEQTIIKVKRKFPDAQDKSIRIWFNKAKKGK